MQRNNEDTLNRLKELNGEQSDIPATSTLDEDEKRAHLDSFKQDMGERKIYASKTFRFICIYMFSVFIILVAKGFAAFPFDLSDKVLIVLLTTTTANVLIVFHFVMKYLFNKI